MLDYIIRDGQVVTPGGVGTWDVGIRGEKIVAIAETGTLTDTVGRVIDASGKIVVPGGIEPHAHVAAPIMGHDKETAPPPEVSRAALFGGTTLLADFAIQFPGRDIFQAIEERNGRWRGQSYADYTYHCMLLGDIPSEVMAQIPQVIEAGDVVGISRRDPQRVPYTLERNEPFANQVDRHRPHEFEVYFDLVQIHDRDVQPLAQETEHFTFIDWKVRT